MKRVGQIYREDFVSKIKEGIGNNNAFLLSHSNVAGNQLSDFRKTLKASGARMNASKNSLVRIALKDLKFDALADKVERQTSVVWSDKDAVELAKILVKFEESLDEVKIQGGIVEGGVLEPVDIKRLSDLPSREVLLSQLFAAIQSPLTRFATALNAKTRELLSVLKQLADKKK